METIKKIAKPIDTTSLIVIAGTFLVLLGVLDMHAQNVVDRFLIEEQERGMITLINK